MANNGAYTKRDALHNYEWCIGWCITSSVYTYGKWKPCIVTVLWFSWFSAYTVLYCDSLMAFMKMADL